jgi:hypothetical protein
VGNATTVIEVEGVHWGTAAWTKILRASDGDSSYYGLPIGKLLCVRQGLTRKQVEKAQRRRRKEPDQLADINEMAAAILEHARDVLKGDFSQLEQIAEKNHRKRLAKALPMKEKAAIVGASEAGHAFKRGDYTKVVELLGPHLLYLSPSQRKQYAIAKGAIGGAEIVPIP